MRKVFPARKAGKPTSILFLKLVEQGATVLAYSAIQKAIDQVGRENVYFCLFKENRPILDIMDVIPKENVIEIRMSNIFIFAIDVLKLLIRCRSEKVDTTIDMEFFSRAAAILAYLSGARIRVGLHRFKSELPYRGDLMTHQIQYNPYLHISRAYLQLVESLNHDPLVMPMFKEASSSLITSAPKFEPGGDERRDIDSLINQKLGKTHNGPLILLNPNASDMLPLRKWPTDRFVALGQRLLDAFPEATIVLTGAPAEKGACEIIRNQFKNDRVISVAGFTTLRDLMVLYAQADVLVTNDSGPGHFASMTEVQTVVLFGPETPELFGPLGDNIHIIWANLACSPCVNAFNHRFSPCTDNVCMQKISVEVVYEQVRSLLESSAKDVEAQTR
ncbi:MAG: glycosyltransferase family 9 protein [Flavobacteriales bacterium]|nr:glycosyltransferase family 9 protein [Flavobacteriales bacterium]